MKYFTFNELCASATAQRKGIDNTANAQVRVNLTALVSNLLDPLREKFGGPIIVTSGYRCAKLNRAVGGTSKSQHLTGQAVDIKPASNKAADMRRLFDLVQTSGLPFDQLIWEYGTKTAPAWVHVSFCEGRNRRQVLYIGVK